MTTITNVSNTTIVIPGVGAVAPGETLEVPGTVADALLRDDARVSAPKPKRKATTPEPAEGDE